VITPANLSTMSVSEKAASASWPRFQIRPDTDCGRFTLMLNTTRPA
jgi:hypothetical protein